MPVCWLGVLPWGDDWLDDELEDCDGLDDALEGELEDDDDGDEELEELELEEELEDEELEDEDELDEELLDDCVGGVTQPDTTIISTIDIANLDISIVLFILIILSSMLLKSIQHFNVSAHNWLTIFQFRSKWCGINSIFSHTPESDTVFRVCSQYLKVSDSAVFCNIELDINIF